MESTMTITDFYQRCYPQLSSAWVEIMWGENNPQTPQTLKMLGHHYLQIPQDLEKFPAIIQKAYEKHWHLYHGVLLRSVQRLEKNVQGRNEDVHHFHTLFLDIDGKDLDPQNLDHGVQLIDEILQTPFWQKTLRPTAVIDSGGGRHIYFVLQSPFPSKDLWERLMPGLYHAFLDQIQGRDTFSVAEHAYKSAHDARRILRVPLSTNWKPKYGPQGRLVNILSLTDHTYTAETMQRLLQPWIQRRQQSLQQSPHSLSSQNEPLENKEKEILFYLQNGAQDGERHAATNILVGHLLAHGIAPSLIQEWMLLWWQQKVSNKTSRDTQVFQKQIQDLIQRYQDSAELRAEQPPESVFKECLHMVPGLYSPVLRTQRAAVIQAVKQYPPTYILYILQSVHHDPNFPPEQRLSDRDLQRLVLWAIKKKSQK